MLHLELQQSPLYQQYVKKLGWTVLCIDGVAVFIKKIPLLGVFAKIQRPALLPSISKVIPVLLQYRTNRLAVDTHPSQSQKELDMWIRSVSKFFRIHTSPYLPTKTIVIDISKSESDIFQACFPAKRRGMRRAEKNNVRVMQSENIFDLIAVKNTSEGLFGGITTYGIDKLWNIFYPNHAAILLAYREKKIVAGVLLLLHEKTAYYWIAGATRQGKKLFAPTLLVWESLKYSKKHGCSRFDFVGVWDERMPAYYKDWIGFTKFKEGFGGIPLYYPIATLRR